MANRQLKGEWSIGDKHCTIEDSTGGSFRVINERQKGATAKWTEPDGFYAEKGWDGSTKDLYAVYFEPDDTIYWGNGTKWKRVVD